MRKTYGLADLRLLPRLGRGRALMVATTVVALLAAFTVVLNPPGIPGDGETRARAFFGGEAETRWGPMTATDRSLLVKVRQAGLWEIPAGAQAQQRAQGARVKEVARIIMEQHQRLDEDVRATARRLGVIVPNEPSATQKQWLAELTRLFGGDYDRMFVLRLRAAHGKVFGFLAKVRASTQNSIIRAFALRAIAYVGTHMSLLESTGLVTKAALT